MLRTFFRAATAAAFAFAMVAPAYGQATRTWVSGVGDDVNPCSRTAPCKTFAGAISKTAAGGEINCLDPGGFGTLTITKSITIDCTGTFGSTLNSGGINGFVVNDSLSATPGTARVILRGLSINGAGTTPGLNGVRFISGASLVMEDVFIQNQQSGAGVSIQPSGPAEIFMTNVTIANGGSGIVVQPTGASGFARVELQNVRVLNNATVGMRVETTGNSSPTATAVSIVDSQFSGSPIGLSAITPASGAPAVNVTLANSLVDHNTNNGLLAQGALATIRVSGTTISDNSIGVATAASGAVRTYGDNLVDGNTLPGAFTSVIPKT